MTKTAVVTGASRGIGYEVSLELANRGHRVVALARSEESLHLLQEEFPYLIKAFPADLTDDEDIDRFVSFFEKEYEKADVLINNAGGLVNKSFSSLSREDWHRMINANLISNILITRNLLPHFAPGAHVVNISSMGGFQGSTKFPGLSAYSATKGAVSILTECLAVELAERDIKVNALCLGAVQTEMLNRAFPGFEAPVTAEKMGRYIANFALEGSDFYNGQILPVTLSDPG